MKIAVTDQLPETPPVEDYIRKAIDATAKLLESQGHIIVEAAPEYDAAIFHRANYVAWMSFLAAGVFGLSGLLGVEANQDTVEAATLACAQDGAKLTAMDTEQAFMTFNAISRSFGHFMTEYDALLLPLTTGAPIKLGQLNQNDPNYTSQEWYNAIFFGNFPFGAQFNMTGQPAISIPAGLHKDLPISVQIAGPMGDEATLLQIARDIEEARPWWDIRPGIFAA